MSHLSGARHTSHRLPSALGGGRLASSRLLGVLRSSVLLSVSGVCDQVHEALDLVDQASGVSLWCGSVSAFAHLFSPSHSEQPLHSYMKRYSGFTVRTVMVSMKNSKLWPL